MIDIPGWIIPESLWDINVNNGLTNTTLKLQVQELIDILTAYSPCDILDTHGKNHTTRAGLSLINKDVRLALTQVYKIDYKHDDTPNFTTYRMSPGAARTLIKQILYNKTIQALGM